jgi:ornithine--oxo-acid transaminase
MRAANSALQSIYPVLKFDAHDTNRNITIAHCDHLQLKNSRKQVQAMAPHADDKASAAAATRPSVHAASSAAAIAAESEYAAHNYHPLPVVFARASGVNVWDPEGRHYFDFLSAYSAVNQGHCHPELVKALADQAGRLALSSRAFHNDVFPRWAQKVRDVFGYDMVLPMCTGAEAVESAIKIARKWAYKVKGVEQGRAMVFGAAGNFHGRTVGSPSLV